MEGRNAAYGITASGNTSVINIDGDLSASSPVDIRTVDVYGATVNINGNVSAKGNDNERGGLHETIAAFLGGKVNVSGDVFTEGQGMIAAYSQNDSLIRVSGNVTASGKRSFATLAWSYGSIDITGDVSAYGENARAAESETFSTVKINGDVSARRTCLSELLPGIEAP